MVPTYNGWEDPREDEREALELWEARERSGRRSSQRIPLPDLTGVVDRQGTAL
ncbi:MAG TPA: hypothetical protein VFZ90_08235 [Gemmatimonadales bacterium]|jgi:hypothetical protein